jgi:hypothetical protein
VSVSPRRLLGLFHSEDNRTTILRTVGNYLPADTSKETSVFSTYQPIHPRRLQYSARIKFLQQPAVRLWFLLVLVGFVRRIPKYCTKAAALWGAAPYSSVHMYRRFRGAVSRNYTAMRTAKLTRPVYVFILYKDNLYSAEIDPTRICAGQKQTQVSSN